MSISVLLADDHAMVREGLSQLLAHQAGFSVVGETGDAASAIELAARMRPDVVLLDYSMPGLDAATAIEHLRREHASLKILVLTVHDNLHYALRTLEAGAHGFVVKSAAAQELIEAIRTVFAGELYVSPTISQRVLQHLRQGRERRTDLAALSQREFDVLRVLGAGLSLTQAAAHLGIGTSTVSTYRARLMEKLGLETTAQLIRYAIEHDVVG